MHTQLTHLHPFREMENFAEHYARAVNRAFLQHEQRVATAAIAEWAPTVDVSENDAEYGVRAELPGVEKEDVKVLVENGVLTIQGENKVEVSEGQGVKNSA